VEKTKTPSSEAKCPLPAEEGWVMEKKEKSERKRKRKRENEKSKYRCGYVKKPMVGGNHGFK